MISFLCLLISFITAAQSPNYWNHMTSVMDRHEFYANNEMIVKPKDSWQTLFSIVYTDQELKEIKDCLFYRVPGVENGILKMKTIGSKDQCEKYILSPGDKEWKDIKALQFSTSPERVTLDMTFTQYKSQKWVIPITNSFESPTPKMHMSSSEFKSPNIIFLAPKKNIQSTYIQEELKNGTLCHDINDDCEERSSSTCSLCTEGWYEIPNGCFEGPKYCGRQDCGQKDGPACRRGMIWQRGEEKEFDCRSDSSFAYCRKGLSVSCQGKLAYCR